MSISAHRSTTTFEEEVATLEEELEADGFLRFRAIGPLYERVKVQDPTTRRQMQEKELVNVKDSVR